MATESEISGRSVKACRMFKNAIMYLSEFIADRLIANSTPKPTIITYHQVFNYLMVFGTNYHKGNRFQ